MPFFAEPAGGEESQSMAQMLTPRCTVPTGATWRRTAQRPRRPAAGGG